MAQVFQHVSVFPQDNDKTIVAWRLHPRFCAPGPYTFTIEVSDHLENKQPAQENTTPPSGAGSNDTFTVTPTNPGQENTAPPSGAGSNGTFTVTPTSSQTGWETVATVVDTDWAAIPHNQLEVIDPKRKRWSTVETWFYRVQLRTPEGRKETSYVEPSWGSLPRHERLTAREIFRREMLRFEKSGAGVVGWLFRRRWWGPIHEPAVDVNTLEVIHPYNTVSYGTPYVGGYFKEMEYWLDFSTGPNRTFDRTTSGTRSQRTRQARGVAWPPPGSFDVWVDSVSGRRFYINAVEPVASIRNVPITVGIQLTEAPPTDIAYEIPFTTDDPDAS